MITVVHVVVAGEVGGAERMLVDLARADDEARVRHVVALATPSERLRGVFATAGLDVEDRGPVREGPLTYLVRSLGPGDVRWLEGVVRGRRGDVVHVHTFGSQVLGTRAAIRAGARVVRTEHSTRVYDDPSCWPFSRWSLEHADAAVAISEAVRRRAMERAPWAASKLLVVPNGVDVTRFAETPLPPDEGPLRLLALGRLDRRKGLDLAIAALARVPGVTLEIVGDGGERRALEALVRARGVRDRVTFAGFASDPLPAIRRAHALLSSARAEGLGIALLEGMATGRPVIALPTGGVPEIVRDGETGWLAYGSDETALVRALESAVRERSALAERGARARDLVRTQYDLRTMRDGYARVYAEVVSGRAAPGVSGCPGSGS